MIEWNSLLPHTGRPEAGHIAWGGADGGKGKGRWNEWRGG